MQQRNKPFAPFGAVLFKLRSENIQLTYSPYLFCGRYALAEARRMNGTGCIALCLPYKSKVMEYRWPVADLSLILFDTGEMLEQELKEIAFALLKENAKQVCVYRTDPPGIEAYNLN